MSKRIKRTEMDHRRLWTPYTHWLPGKFKARLDAEGKVRGVTWRQMPPGGQHKREDIQAMNWFLWKRHLLVHSDLIMTRDQRAKYDALRSIEQSEKGEELDHE